MNTFQVALSDGTNPVMGIGHNVCFSWDNMCWTTGDASGGSGGFGGSPAIVGADRGNGVDYFQIGAFDHAGTDYDGPYGSNDGVSYLDYAWTCFTTGGFVNVPPIPQGFPSGNEITVDACLDEVLDLTLQFISPEQGQSVTVTINDVNAAQTAGLVITSDSPNLEIVTAELDWDPDASDVGTYLLEFTAVDDFNPPGQTEITLEINIICTAPAQPCCFADGTCLTLIPIDCIAQGGTPQGTGSACGGIQACCLADGSCTMADALCCVNELGGEPEGPGSQCTALQACCLANGTCRMLDPLCCMDLGGEPQGAEKQCAALQACCMLNDTCGMLDPLCCVDAGGNPMGAGSTCEGDVDHDGVDGTCGNLCPDDPNKTEPGICGCGVADTDSDGDTVPDCIDQCPGQDDRIDANGNGIPDCLEGNIPAASTWGLVTLALLLLAGAKVYFSGARREEPRV